MGGQFGGWIHFSIWPFWRFRGVIWRLFGQIGGSSPCFHFFWPKWLLSTSINKGGKRETKVKKVKKGIMGKKGKGVNKVMYESEMGEKREQRY